MLIICLVIAGIIEGIIVLLYVITLVGMIALSLGLTSCVL